MRASRKFQGCFKEFQGCFKSILGVIHGSFKVACKQVSSGFNRVLRKLQCSFQGDMEGVSDGLLGDRFCRDNVVEYQVGVWD